MTAEWLAAAIQMAMRSHDPTTQNGAVIVSPYSHLSVSACNGFPAGLAETPERWEGPKKYQYCEHAERAAIILAGRTGFATDGATLYCPWYACPDCARAIIAVGIREVVGHRLLFELTPPKWAEEVSVGLEMLAEAGVVTRWLEGPIGGRIRFAGKEIDL